MTNVDAQGENINMDRACLVKLPHRAIAEADWKYEGGRASSATPSVCSEQLLAIFRSNTCGGGILTRSPDCVMEREVG
jgi:hypothetical protein